MVDKIFDKRVAIILIIILLVGSISAGFAHIIIYNFTIIQWLLVNMCSPSSIAISIGLIIYIFKPEKPIGYYLVACCDFLFAFSILENCAFSFYDQFQEVWGGNIRFETIFDTSIFCEERI